MSSTWLIVPARGASKGILGKNVAMVGGVPLVRRAILTALSANEIDKVILSTDSNGIAAVCQDLPIQIVWRPEELASDTASSESALLHVLEELGSTDSSKQPESIIMMQCTSPFTRSLDVSNVAQSLKEFDCALTVTPDHTFRWSRNQDDEAIGIGHNPLETRLRRQDLPPGFRETGSLYGMRTKGFLAHRNRFFGKIGLVEVPIEVSLEIDEMQDLESAQKLAHAMQSSSMDKEPRLADIQAVVFDFDGVMTDNRVIVTEQGHEAVLCSRSDGLAIEELHEQRIPMLIISKERNPVVKARASKLNVPVKSSSDDKVLVLRNWAKAESIDLENIAYIGNDVNDLDVLKIVGVGVCPSDAHYSIKPHCKVVLHAAGGMGAIREFSDLLITAKKKGVIT